jgi:nucleotide-binding universal stress UspA family protein
MTGRDAQETTPSPRTEARRQAQAAEHPDIAHLVVPLDGSPFAERALPVAGWAAAELDADVHAVEIVRGDEEAEAAIRYLDSVARHHATRWDVVQRDDVGAALTEMVAQSPSWIACMATHGRDRTSLAGSVTADVLDRSDRPIILVGPAARPVTTADAPVVVAVDGTPRDDELVSTALGLATTLGRRLDIVTADAPGSGAGAPAWPAPRATDPHESVASLAARVAGGGVEVTCGVAEDPACVRDGLLPLLDRTAALVVLGSGPAPTASGKGLGSEAARIVHDAQVPALAVPVPGAI